MNPSAPHGRDNGYDHNDDSDHHHDRSRGHNGCYDCNRGHSTGDSHSRRHTSPRYSRRTLLATVTVGSVSVTAGCLADEEPASDPSAGEGGDGNRDRNGSADNPTDDDGLAFFEDYLENEGVDVTDLSVDGTTVELTYATDRTTDQELGDEIGTIAGGYVLAGDHGLETGRLDATISDGEQALATWHVRETWIEEFEGGELSPGELTTNVLNTLELVEDS